MVLLKVTNLRKTFTKIDLLTRFDLKSFHNVLFNFLSVFNKFFIKVINRSSCANAS